MVGELTGCGQARLSLETGLSLDWRASKVGAGRGLPRGLSLSFQRTEPAACPRPG